VVRKAADITGSFEAQVGGAGSGKLDSLQFNMTFSKLGPAGQLGISFSDSAPAGSGNSSSVSSGTLASGSLARWPANAACENDPLSGPSFPARVDQRVDQFSAQDGIERFNAAGLQLGAAGAAATQLHASFAPTGSACAQLEQSTFGPATAIPRTSLYLHGSIVASLVEASAFEATYGIHGFDLTGYDQAGVVLDLTVGPAAAVSGALTVNGVKRPNCQTRAAQPALPGSSSAASAGTAPCAGLQFTALWTAPITAR
jgi:hypothetical protein